MPILNLNFKKGWPYWLIGWFGPGLLTLLGAALFFLIFPSSFDPQLTLLANQLKSAGATGDFDQSASISCSAK